MDQFQVKTSSVELNHLITKIKHGNDTSDKHLLTFFALAMSIGARRILELGVRDGSSTSPWIMAAMELDGLLTV